MHEPESPTRDHRLADPLLLVGLLVHGLHAEGVAVEGDRLVQVGNRDAHVVDSGEEVESGGSCGHRAAGVTRCHGL